MVMLVSYSKSSHDDASAWRIILASSIPLFFIPAICGDINPCTYSTHTHTHPMILALSLAIPLSYEEDGAGTRCALGARRSPASHRSCQLRAISASLRKGAQIFQILA